MGLERGEVRLGSRPSDQGLDQEVRVEMNHRTGLSAPFAQEVLPRCGLLPCQMETALQLPERLERRYSLPRRSRWRPWPRRSLCRRPLAGTSPRLSPALPAQPRCLRRFPGEGLPSAWCKDISCGPASARSFPATRSLPVGGPRRFDLMLIL
jgi:hypothetical protein